MKKLKKPTKRTVRYMLIGAALGIVILTPLAMLLTWSPMSLTERIWNGMAAGVLIGALNGRAWAKQ